MPEPIVLNDATLGPVLDGDRPALILVSNGDGLRGDFVSAFRKAAADYPNIVVAQIDPTANPDAAVRFDAGSKGVLIGWFAGQELVRRPRPWGTDVPLAIEMLEAALRERQPVQEEVSESEVSEKNGAKSVTNPVINDQPVHVTDATFEAEVLNSELPVLIDFWAEWCGPCRMVAPTLDKLAKEFAGQVRIAKVNVDENPGLSQAFRVMSIPTIMLVKERTIVFSQPGALPEAAFRDLIQQLIALELPPREEEESSEEAVQQ